MAAKASMFAAITGRRFRTSDAMRSTRKPRQRPTERFQARLHGILSHARFNHHVAIEKQIADQADTPRRKACQQFFETFAAE